jgi:hypothetical protein
MAYEKDRLESLTDVYFILQTKNRYVLLKPLYLSVDFICVLLY